MTKEEGKMGLYNYVTYILLFEYELKKAYGLANHPYLNKHLIPKKGSISIDSLSYDYLFHGAGCSFIFNTIEIDYNIYVDRKNYIVTSPWKLKQFLESWNSMNIQEEEVKNLLEEFYIEGIVKKIYPEYSVYEVSFEWYNDFYLQTTKN